MSQANTDEQPEQRSADDQSRRAFLAGIGIVLSLSSTASAPGADVEEPGPDDARERLASMRRLAQRVKVVELDDEMPGPTVPLHAEPLHRYGNRAYGILDGTLWAWGERGRPAGLIKVELWPDRDNGRGRWSFGVSAASPRRIAVEFRDGFHWASRNPGITLEDVPAAPKPGDTVGKRLAQAKELARQLSAHAENPKLPNGIELRLLPTPVHRYADANSGLVDGLVFAFVAATNPEILVFYEVGPTGQGEPTWRYGFLRLGTSAVTVRHENAMAWSCPYAPPPSNTENYMNRSLPKGVENE